MSNRPLVLIVDDEPFMRQWIARQLQRIGIDTCEAADNTTAIEQALAHRPQLITTDMYRSGGTGLAFIHQVRAQPALQEVPIVMMSGGATLEDRRNAEQAGAAVVLAKPFTSSELHAAIMQVLPHDG
jgi:two-component system phosphate regulon response regulator PhoB